MMLILFIGSCFLVGTGAYGYWTFRDKAFLWAVALGIAGFVSIGMFWYFEHKQ